MGSRGGQQRIPRPESARPGRPPSWAHLDAAARRFRLDDVRRACASLPAPRRPEAPSTARPAAVLVALFEEDGDSRVILTKRPDTMPSHQGEIAFPGGKMEDDPSLQDAALREAQEEIGLDPAGVEVVAELDSILTVMGRFVLTPFVGLLPARPVIERDPTEVVSVFDVAIAELLDEATFREERWDLGVGRDHPIHFFELPGETVWGATARILTGFLEHLTSTRA